jgi:hypothetical protein
MVAIGGEWFGGSLAMLVARPSKERPVGIRLEGRLHPLYLGPVRPYFALGSTAFLPELSLRGALGADLYLGRFLLEADFAFEHYPSPADTRRSTAMIASLGIGFTL